MKIGKPNIIACPACSAGHTQMCLMSGNMFDTTYFSDGNYIASMMPQISPYTRCSKCDVFYKITDDNTSSGDNRSWEELDKIPNVEDLSVKGMVLAINEGLYNGTDEDAAILRTMLWREMNIKRKYHSKEENNEEKIYTENCRELLSAIQEDGDTKLLTKAELYRNLGEFDECRELLVRITTPEKHTQYITAIKKACDRRDIFTLRIGEDEEDEQRLIELAEAGDKNAIAELRDMYDNNEESGW